MKTLPLTALVLVAALCGGCQALWHGGSYEQVRHGSSSSLVSFLYPEGDVPPQPSESLPYLELPLRVGIAFVPEHHGSGISPTDKALLGATVAETFADRPFVTSIEVIPDHYLRSSRGLAGMDQLANLFNVDVIALISHDQISYAGERDSAILYWTIVGALTVKGNSNEVRTLVDTAVFDATSKQLLFRAPGVHQGARNSTLVSSERELRTLKGEGLSNATNAMIANLDTELERFAEDVKNGQRAEVTWKPGSGGGSVGWLGLALLYGFCFRRREFWYHSSRSSALTQ